MTHIEQSMNMLFETLKQHTFPEIHHLTIQKVPQSQISNTKWVISLTLESSFMSLVRLDGDDLGAYRLYLSGKLWFVHPECLHAFLKSLNETEQAYGMPFTSLVCEPDHDDYASFLVTHGYQPPRTHNEWFGQSNERSRMYVCTHAPEKMTAFTNECNRIQTYFNRRYEEDPLVQGELIPVTARREKGAISLSLYGSNHVFTRTYQDGRSMYHLGTHVIGLEQNHTERDFDMVVSSLQKERSVRNVLSPPRTQFDDLMNEMDLGRYKDILYDKIQAFFSPMELERASARTRQHVPYSLLKTAVPHTSMMFVDMLGLYVLSDNAFEWFDVCRNAEELASCVGRRLDEKKQFIVSSIQKNVEPPFTLQKGISKAGLE